MAELLTALGINQKKQGTLAEDVFVAEDLVIAMQRFYEQMPENKTKETVETTIVELIGEIVRETNK
jgi:hypothetical protein